MAGGRVDAQGGQATREAKAEARGEEAAPSWTSVVEVKTGRPAEEAMRGGAAEGRGQRALLTPRLARPRRPVPTLACTGNLGGPSTWVLADRRVLQGCRDAPSLGRPPKQLHPAMMRPFAPGPSIHLPACQPASGPSTWMTRTRMPSTSFFPPWPQPMPYGPLR